MSLDQDILACLPPRAKKSPSGWISFNAPCCHHRGHNQDKRKRGGVMADAGTISYHCFNCGYKASWAPGRLLSEKMKQFLSWLGVADSDIQKMAIQALKNLNQEAPHQQNTVKFEPRPLPEGSRLLSDIVEEDSDSVLPVLEYLAKRKFYLDDYPWYWSPNIMYKNRIIIPIYNEGECVGSTSRAISNDINPRYLSSCPPGLVFNIDKQIDQRKFVIVVEGIFDAIAIDGVAVMGGQLSQHQIQQINSLQKDVIVVPDRDAVGKEMTEKVTELGWSVSLPPWPEGIKDVADACVKLGRLATMALILKHKETNLLKTKLTARNWFEKYSTT